MRKIYFLLVTLVIAASTTFGQVTGTKTIGVDYPTIAAAITDLNTVGVGAGGATINVPAGYTETVPSGGLVLGSTTLNASLGAGNPLVFQKSGAGANPLLTAFTGGSSTTSDGIFKIQGADFVTIDRIDLRENPANTLAALMEWGYALVNLNGVAPFDGCQNVKIQNCAITMERTNPNASMAIYASHNIATNNTALIITAAGDLHSDNKFYGNTISNASFGIFILGYNAATPFTLYDQNNDVGGSSPATGNSISNIGNMTGFNSFGVYMVYQNGANASYNTIPYFQGFGGTAVAYGIYIFGTNSNATATNNTVTVGQAIGTGNVVGIYGQNTGNFTATNNSIAFQDAGGSGGHYGIWTASAATVNISNNTFTASNTGGVTGTYQFIYDATTGTGETFTNNVFNNINISTTGTTYLIYASNSTPNQTVTGNATSGTINRTGASGTMYCYYNFGSPGSGTATITGNNFSNINISGTTAFNGIYQATGTGQTENVNNNTVSNISGGTGTMIGVYHSYGAIGSTANSNTVNNISGGGTVTGMSIGTSSASLGSTFTGNTVSNLSSTGASTVTGMLHTSGANVTIYKNKIYSLQANNATGIANGLTFSAGTGTANIYNNLIGDLRAPSTSSATDGVRGINITSASTVSNINVHYNTIYLNASSSGANFGASGIFHTTSTTATTASLTLRNNIIYNNSFAKGTGFVTAFRRSSGAANTLNNYNAASDRNLFFAGAPSASQLIYYDGTSSAQTLAAYKAGVFTAGTIAPRDANSVTELSTPFLSTNGALATFLHINPAIPTVVEGSGATIAGVTDDYDGDTRNVTTPDIGADEFAGITVPACAGTPVAGSITGSANICAGQSTILNATGFTSATGISLQWQSSATPGGPYSPIVGAIGSSYNTGVIATGTTVYYVVTVTCSNGGASATTAEFAVTSNALPTIGVSPGSPTICSGGAGVSLTATGGVSYTWSPATGLSATTGATVTANPTSTTIYTVTGANGFGCTNTATSTVNVNPSPVISSLTATPATICYNGNSQLQATVSGSMSSSYVQSSLTGQTYTQLTGAGITIINTNAQLTPTFGSGSQDDGGVLITIPFAFNYNGTNYTQMSMSTNGWVAAGNYSTIDAVNSRAPANLFTTAIPNGTIAAWFKDMGANFPLGAGSMRHGLIGTDVYAFQWDQAVGSGFSDGSTILISFQVNIYGPASSAPGRIDMIYGPTVGAISFAASLGIEHQAGTSYINALTGTGSSTITSTIWPGNGNGYRYDLATYNYSWSPATFLSATNIANPMANNVTATTTYTVTVTGSNGCSTNGNVTVTIDPAQFTVTGGGSFCQSGTGVPVGLSGSQTGVNYQLYEGVNPVGSPVAGTGSAISFGIQNIAGTYTVVGTNTSTACSGPMTGSAVLSYLPAPVLSQSSIQPTTCVSNDGSINLTVTGSAPGPYNYNWSTVGGSGLTPGVEDQSGLSVGQYTVVVTASNGCQSTLVIAMPGPGGCSICPSIGALVSNPTPAVCQNASVTFTASGLAAMGVTYGITFVQSTSALADPYVGGTVMGTVPNGSLSSGGTVATLITSFATPGTYFVYAILSPTPADPLCRPFMVVPLTVNPTPNAVATPASQTICSGGTITTIVLSGAVPGTTYAWTRDNTGTVTGIAGSGSGNISGSLTNTTASPITVTFTITPTANGCPGAPITATVLVNPTPVAVATPPSQTSCSGQPITTIALTSTTPGTTFAWTRNNTATVTGIPASGSGSISGTLTNTTTAPITVTFTITPTANGCPGAPITATVTVNPTPTVSTGSMQVIITGVGEFADEITWTLTNSVGTVILSGGPYGFNPPPTPSAIVPATSPPFTFQISAAGFFGDNGCLWEVRCNGSVVASGCIRGPNSFFTCPNTGVYTLPGINGCGSNIAAQTICSGSAITPITLVGSIPGTTFNWTRNNTATVTGIAASGTGNISGTLTNTTTAPVTTTFTITPTAGGCNGPSVNVPVTVNPIPVATATPSSQTICSGTAITTIVLSSPVAGTTYAWTRTNTATTTGIAASGSGNISGSLTNTTTLPVTTTFTITPTANGCAGTPITATVTVNPLPTISCPANITVPSVVGGCTAVVNYSPVVTGTPTPTVTYVFSGATTGSGSGTGSGSAFNVGTTTVTLTATTICGVATCAFTITVTDSQLPVISVQPANRNSCVGSNATFSVTATNVLSYQWQTFSGGSWNNISGATASSYTVSNVTLAMNTNSYRVILTGLCTVVTSASATLFVNSLPIITINSSLPPALIPGQFTTLTAMGIPPGGSYVWLLNGSVMTGVSGNVLTGIGIDNQGSYQVRYTDPNGCTSTSAPLVVTGMQTQTMWVYPNPNQGQFTVRFYNLNPENATVNVYNSRGQKVFQKTVITTLPYTQIEVDLGPVVPSGGYVVELVNQAGNRVGAKTILVRKR